MLDPVNNAIDRIRLSCGDTETPYWLEDSVYQYALTSSKDNEKAATKKCAQYILAALTRNAHEKLVQIEIYGSEYFENYRLFILSVIRDPSSGNVAPIPYGGGVMKEEQSQLIANGDVNICKSPVKVFRGRKW